MNRSSNRDPFQPDLFDLAFDQRQPGFEILVRRGPPQELVKVLAIDGDGRHGVGSVLHPFGADHLQIGGEEIADVVGTVAEVVARVEVDLLGCLTRFMNRQPSEWINPRRNRHGYRSAMSRCHGAR